MEQRFSDNDESRRDIPSFIEPRPPLVHNPFMRPRPQKGTNLLEQFEEDSEMEEPELVQVYLRMKPCNVPNNLYEVKSDRCLVTSMDTTTAGHGRRTQHNVSRMYTFSRIFDEQCSQKEIFEEVVKENLKKLPEGESFTLLTYGASGSGKTYTLMGTVNSPGLVPRSLEYVFNLVDTAQMPNYKPCDTGADQLNYAQQDSELQWVKRLRQVSAPQRDKYRRMSVLMRKDLAASNFDLSNRTRYYVWVSFVEIYNEAIYDLLATPDKRVKMRIREDSSGNVYVKDVTQAFVRSGEEAYDVMVAGKLNLVVAATGVHAHSSRSHCIFTITMLTENGAGEIRTSHVRLCDLAGCERQRATRNTGARMQESRAINSSLHVLERCLHMLRRKQKLTKETSLVPYRESKLTRLLGSGLSGSRGEAVSMVVTLNPAPQYAHETKHVLSLAAVAQDIQINNTMYTSTLSSLESISQVSATSPSVEVMKLKAELERVHFELIQAQNWNKELLASMEQKQQQTGNTMRELVEQTKDMMKQYYEAEIQSLQNKMDDMIDEYESRLSKQAAPALDRGTGTPARYLQAKVAQLMTEITVLEDKISAEKLARSRAEKEVQHLRNCIEERDDKAFKDTAENEELVVLTDSDSESDADPSDPFNESLEPVFKKDCINTSHALLNKSSKILESSKIEKKAENDEDSESNEDEYNDTLNHDESVNTSQDSSTSEENVTVDEKQIESTLDSMANFTQNIDDVNAKEISNRVNDTDNSVLNITHTDQDNSELEKLEDHKIKTINTLRGTYFVKEPDSFTYNKIDIENDITKDNEANTDEINRPKKVTESLVNKIFKSLKTNQDNDSSLTQFEQLEMASNNVDNSKDKSNDSIDLKILNEKKKYFDDTINEVSNAAAVISKPIVTENLTVEAVKFNDKVPDVLVKDTKQEKSKYFEHNTNDDKLSYLSSEAKTQKKQLYFDDHKNTSHAKTIAKMQQNSAYIFETKTDSKSNQFSTAVKTKSNQFSTAVKTKSNQFSTAVKTQKKQLLFDDSDNTPPAMTCAKTQEKMSYIFGTTTDNFKSTNVSSAALIQGKHLYFDDNEETSYKDVFPSGSGEKHTYFDKIPATVGSVPNKKVNEILTNTNKDEERSPSIVKDDIEKDYKPSRAVMKLLGESFTKPELLSSINKNKGFVKKQKSGDIFDSPQMNVAKAEEIIEDVVITSTVNIDKTEKVIDITKELSNVESLRNSIGRLVLDQKTKADVKHEIKLEPASSIEEPDILHKSKSDVTENQAKEQSLDEAHTSKENNTIDEFENICKDLTNIRDTEFDLLVSQVDSNVKENISDQDSPPTVKKKNYKEISEETKYNLRCKGKSITKRNLRLRRRKNVDEENSDQDTESKLRDIINLKKEFSDVTMGLPPMKKEVKDIPSPEKLPGEENLPPMLGIQSCPSKSVTRSRRKLFTPRAEPLEESASPCDSNERVVVPRPSYHRTRTRRKL